MPGICGLAGYDLAFTLGENTPPTPQRTAVTLLFRISYYEKAEFTNAQRMPTNTVVMFLI